MTKQRATRAFVELSNRGSQDGRVKRSFCELDAPFEMSNIFRFGGGVVKTKEPPVVAKLSGALLEDMPSCAGGMIVSERLRAWIEERAPKHAQWIPVVFRGPKKRIPQVPYFLANWLNVVDCIDWKKSEYEKDVLQGREASYFFNRMVIEPSRVPVKVLVFRVKHSEVDLCIDVSMAQAMHAAGFSGPQFYRGGNSIAEEFVGF